MAGGEWGVGPGGDSMSSRLGDDVPLVMGGGGGWGGGVGGSSTTC